MNIALVDDHIVVADSIKMFLQTIPAVKEVKTFTSGAACREYYDSTGTGPDILITDLLMPDTNGITLIETIQKNQEGKVGIIVLSSVGNVQTIRQAFRSGAKAFVSKAAPSEELAKAIAEVSAGRMYVSTNLQDGLLSNGFGGEKKTYSLSPREREVLQYVCSGLTIKEIAARLELSPHTVQTYHRLVMEKLNIKRTADLIVYAMQNGLYTPDTDNTIVKPGDDDTAG